MVTSSFLGETVSINERSKKEPSNEGLVEKTPASPESAIGGKSRVIKISETMYNLLNETAKQVNLPLTKVADLWVKSPCCNALLIQDPFTGEILCSKCKTKYKVVKVE